MSASRTTPKELSALLYRVLDCLDNPATEEGEANDVIAEIEATIDELDKPYCRDPPDRGPALDWSEGASVNGTSFRDYYNSPWGFEETIALLVTASGQPAASPDQEKLSVEFRGTFNGSPFTLYDYKEDREIHIGGFDALNTCGLVAALTVALNAVAPTPYQAREYYDARGRHGWPVKR
jgi:hypothetical protein